MRRTVLTSLLSLALLVPLTLLLWQAAFGESGAAAGSRGGPPAVLTTAWGALGVVGAILVVLCCLRLVVALAAGHRDIHLGALGRVLAVPLPPSRGAGEIGAPGGRQSSDRRGRRGGAGTGVRRVARGGTLRRRAVSRGHAPVLHRRARAQRNMAGGGRPPAAVGADEALGDALASSAPLSLPTARRVSQRAPRGGALPATARLPDREAAPEPAEAAGWAGAAVGPAPTRATPRTLPTVRLPDTLTMATALAALFLGHHALAAWRRRSRLHAAPPAPWLLTTPLLTSMVEGTASWPTAPGWLLAVLAGRLRGDEADMVAPHLARLAGDRAGHGLPPRGVRWVREGDSTLTIALAGSQEEPPGPAAGEGRSPAGGAEATAAGADTTAERALARHLGCAAVAMQAAGCQTPAWPVAGPLLTLAGVRPALRGAAPPAPEGDDARAWGGSLAPHPAPLLVPLGAGGDGQSVLHVNLAAVGSVLLASGPTAGARTVLVTLLTHLVAQAPPTQLQLLIGAEAGMLPGAALRSPALPHLLVPLADPADPDALAALLDLAEERVAAGWEHGPAAAGETEDGGEPAAPATAGVSLPSGTTGGTEVAGGGGLAARDGQDRGPETEDGGPASALLVVISPLEALGADWTLATRVAALCAHGPAHGVYVVGHTDDVAALAAQPTLRDAFAGRVACRLRDAAASRAVLGAAGAEHLGSGELLWAVRGGTPERLRALAVAADTAREILAVVSATARPAPRLRLVRPETSPEAGPAGRATGAPAGAPVDAQPPVPGASGEPPQPGDTVAGAGPPASGPGGRPPVALYLLGEPRVEVAGQQVGEIPPLERRLLAYLLLQPARELAREKIEEALWSEAPPGSGTASFHESLYRLRGRLGERLGLAGTRLIRYDRARGLYVLGDPSLFWIDALACGELLDHAAVAQGPRKVDLLRQAVDLYGGDLLGDAPPWAQPRASALRDRYLAALLELARWHEAQGDTPEALAMAQRLAEHAPTEEAYHRRVMRLYHDRLGERELALGHYARLRRYLAEELNAAPAPPTEALYRRILAAGSDEAAADDKETGAPSGS